MEAQSFKIPQEELQQIESLIRSDETPKDASYSKVQLIILHKLMEIQKQISKIEGRLMKPFIP